MGTNESIPKSYIDNIIERFLNPTWKNPYVRISIMTILLLNIDTIALVCSNYKLYEYMRISEGGVKFHLQWLFLLCWWEKLVIAGVVPFFWFLFSLISAFIVWKYQKYMGSIERMTSREHAIRFLREDLLQKDKDNYLLKKKIHNQEVAHEKDLRKMRYVFNASHNCIIDLNDFLNSRAEYVGWLKLFKNHPHVQDLLGVDISELFRADTYKEIMDVYGEHEEKIVDRMFLDQKYAQEGYEENQNKNDEEMRDIEEEEREKFFNKQKNELLRQCGDRSGRRF